MNKCYNQPPHPSRTAWLIWDIGKPMRLEEEYIWNLVEPSELPIKWNRNK